MFSFSRRSEDRLRTCDPRLILVLRKAIEIVDFTVLEGVRDKDAQDNAVKVGNSRLKYPNSKHNKVPSLAVDIAPFPVDWNDTNRFYYLAGVVLTCARQLGVQLTWGGEWTTLKDLPHFEIDTP